MLFLIDDFANSGAGTEGQLWRLIKALDERGTRCHLVTLKRSECLESGGVPCSWTALGHHRLGSPRTWWALYRLARRLRAEGFTLAQTFFNDMSILAPPVLWAAGIRTLISRRDMGFWYTPSYQAVLRGTRWFTAGCIANSHAVARVTAQCERFPPSRLHVIYNGLSEASASQHPHDLRTLKDNGRVLCGLVANIRPIKRIADLIDALAIIASDVPALDVVLVGSGDDAELRERSRRLGLSGRVHLLGKRTDVAGCLRALDIGALCSESEGFSNAVIEYMQAGLPVICTNAGGNPEAVDHGQTGYLYPVGDVERLAHYLAMLVDDSGLRDRLGARARRVARQRFSVTRMVNDHLALYQKLAARDA
jgi:glycosyltransferase involved in cell wall biosynthesis